MNPSARTPLKRSLGTPSKKLYILLRCPSSHAFSGTILSTRRYKKNVEPWVSKVGFSGARGSSGLGAVSTEEHLPIFVPSHINERGLTDFDGGLDLQDDSPSERACLHGRLATRKGAGTAFAVVPRRKKVSARMGSETLDVLFKTWRARLLRRVVNWRLILWIPGRFDKFVRLIHLLQIPHWTTIVDSWAGNAPNLRTNRG